MSTFQIRWVAAAVAAVALVAAALAGVAQAAVPANHSWPGWNGRLVIEAYPPGESCCVNTLTIFPDGSGLNSVYSDGSQTGNLWAISPDGTTLLAGTRTDCVDDILEAFPVTSLVPTHFGHVIDQTPQDLAPSTSVPPCGASTRDAAYSYDGTRVAFARVGATASAGVWVAHSDGSSPQRLYATGNASDLRWSPDGSAISFASGEGTYRVAAGGSSPAVAANPFAPQPGRASNYSATTHDSPPVLSPDGTKIAYLHCCYAELGDVAQVVVANADGTDARGITGFGRIGLCPFGPCGDASRGTVFQLLWQPSLAPDTTAPTVEIGAPAAGTVLRQGAIAYESYSCGDERGGSGIASCTGPIASSMRLDTSIVGHHSFTVRAVDQAGNATTVTHLYEVVPTALGSKQADLAAIRAELVAMRYGLPGYWSRFYLNRAIESADWAAGSNCWTTSGELATTEAGYGCLQALRIVALRLFYANYDLRRASEPQLNETVALISGIARDRFDQVSAVQPIPQYDWIASGPTAPFWSAWRHIGYAETNDNHVEGTIAWIRAWRRLMDVPPAQPAG